MAEQYCKGYVETVFKTWDKDNSNVLSKHEIKLWLRDQQSKGTIKKTIKKQFYDMINNADSNGDGKLDKWELYEACLKNYIPQN